MKKYITALLMLWSCNSHSISGNDLYEMSEDNKLGAVRYVQGLVDYMTFEYAKDSFVAELEKKEFPYSHYICVPRDSNYGQAFEIVINDIKSKPESRHENASELAFYALLKVWRCTK
jgi:hypothetical protein